MQQIINFFQSSWGAFIIALWILPWKGVALWKAADKKQKWWFIALLVVNTLGLFEILYIFVFSKIKKLQVKDTVINSKN